MKDLSGKFVVVIVDCSGSMSADDICRGIDLIKACVSQGLVVPADIEIGWEMKQNIQSLSPDFSEFNKLISYGGTNFASQLKDVQKHVATVVDHILVITDGCFSYEGIEDPGIGVTWLLPKHDIQFGFEPTFGDVVEY